MACMGCGLGATGLITGLKTGVGVQTAYPCPTDHPLFPKVSGLCRPGMTYRSTVTGQTVVVPSSILGGGPTTSAGGTSSNTMYYVIGGLAVLGIAAYILWK